MSVEEDEAEYSTDLFEEPADFRPPTPPPTYTTFERRPEDVEPDTPASLQLRLIGHHSLWAHCLWNAGVALAHHLDGHKELVRGKRIVELGAAAACPSMIAVLNGAEMVVATDYPERPLIENIERNVADNIPQHLQDRIAVRGHLWGSECSDLRDLSGSRGFDVVLLADLVFNHTQHTAMLHSCDRLLKDGSDAEMYVCFTHHRPQYADRDMEFFEKARSPPFNFKVTHMFDEKMPPMFPQDPGDETVRGTVHFYRMTR
eukprot:comp8449_c0_seq1/m.3797 comp8449_c0_seq1/g.3797  ORF comp8449_c0_seq1/g.3797 comp8449_c0_seq1/m.3797 type:complete len:259 (-) comp8449_c0_seq1:422-1198(-)